MYASNHGLVEELSQWIEANVPDSIIKETVVCTYLVSNPLVIARLYDPLAGAEWLISEFHIDVFEDECYAGMRPYPDAEPIWSDICLGYLATLTGPDGKPRVLIDRDFRPAMCCEIEPLRLSSPAGEIHHPKRLGDDLAAWVAVNPAPDSIEDVVIIARLLDRLTASLWWVVSIDDDREQFHACQTIPGESLTWGEHSIVYLEALTDSAGKPRVVIDHQFLPGPMDAVMLEETAPGDPGYPESTWLNALSLLRNEGEGDGFSAAP